MLTVGPVARLLRHKGRHQLTNHISPQIGALSAGQPSMATSCRKHIQLFSFNRSMTSSGVII